MSALTPHIRTLRALSLAFDETAEAMQRLDIEDPVAGGMLNVAAAFERAADALQAEDRSLESGVVSIPPRSADA